MKRRSPVERVMSLDRVPCITRRSRRPLAAMTCAVVAVALACAVDAAAAGGATDGKYFDERVRPFLAAHCVKCHSGGRPKGDFRIDELKADFTNAATLKQWRL